MMDFNRVQALAGNVRPNDLKYIDYYIGNNMGIFVPVGGIFNYATTMHKLPSYLFCILSHNRNYIKIDNQLKAMRPGEMLSVSPNIPHAEVPIDMQSRYWSICIDPTYFESKLKEYGVEKVIYRGSFTKNPEHIMFYIREFIKAHETMDEGKISYLEELETVIVHQIIRSLINENSETAPEIIGSEIEHILDYIHHHYQEKILIDDLSRLVNLSSSRLMAVFKKEIDQSINQYILRLRLERAKFSLMTSKDSIQSIAESNGFKSASYFTTQFKKHYNLLPKAYKQLYRNRY